LVGPLGTNPLQGTRERKNGKEKLAHPTALLISDVNMAAVAAEKIGRSKMSINLFIAGRKVL
jgi:hypothetical protein